jgi:hypothetical protein
MREHPILLRERCRAGRSGELENIWCVDSRGDKK